MKLHPLHPADWVLDHLRDQNWRIHDLLAFTRASTLVLAQRGQQPPVVVKAGFGSNHVHARLDEDTRKAAYGFYWYAQLTDEELALARTDFTHEADTAAAATGLRHVTPLIERGSCADFDWYTMPHSQDGNFRAHLLAAPTQAGLNILADAATGLHNLHQHGIVHRDVYQENILIHQGRGHITDLGASRRAHTPRGPRRRGPEVHWAPEYATDYAKAAPAADVYSLAVLVHRYLAGDIPRLHHEQPGLPADLRQLLRAALATAPHDRPAMPELRDALQEHAQTFPN